MAAELDHLVVAARTLDEGVGWCATRFGITPAAGGRHALMGTHNRVFSLAGARFPRAYLEIIAIDPDAPAPGRARWFGLDALDLAGGPRLVHWVARVDDLDAALARLRAAGHDAGRAIAAERPTPHGLLRWRIAVRDDGRLLGGGALPTLIEWGPLHPCAALPDSRVTLSGLRVTGLDAATIDALDLACIESGRDGPALSARFDTPAGTRTLDA